MYDVVMILWKNLHAGGQSNLGHLSLVHWYEYVTSECMFYTDSDRQINYLRHFVSVG